MSDVKIDQFDHLLENDGPIALALIRELEPAEGKNAWIFPPTFAGSDNGDDEDEGSGKYCIDYWEEPASAQGLSPIKRNMCLINSIGSQANFIEPLFKKDKYSKLVPQRTVKFKDGSVVNLLDAGHRAADAAFRFSKELGKDIWSAFGRIKSDRDYSELIRLAPTSILFGAWDSRATGVKCQRIIRSTIRGYDVVEASRSAIYNPAIDYVDRELINADLDKGKGKDNQLSQEGFKHSPASGSHGGVRVTGSLQQEALINLVVLRSVCQDIIHRRYLLALALVAMSYEDPAAFNLREGCLLRPAVATPDWKEVWIDKSKDTSFEMSHATAFKFAELSTGKGGFKVDQPALPADFDTATAEAWVAKSKKDRKKTSKKMHPSEAVK
jgi:CRISPR-associated protein Csb1